MQPPLSRQVVVLTGASSGIGYCTALHLAGRGARLVLVARGASALEEVERQARLCGTDALAVPADVTSEADLAHVVDAALERHGRIDTWVNNAAVFAQGRLEDFTLDEYARQIEVNLLGTINGTLRALGPMRERRRGVIVQVSSIAAQHGAAYLAGYSASKQGIDGFTEAARAELRGSGVRIATLYLPGVDTPIYQHARAKLGTMPKPPPPVLDPLRAAQAIAELALSGAIHKHVGLFHYAYGLPSAISDEFGDRVMRRVSGFMRSSLPPPERDNLDHPVERAPRMRGGWGRDGWHGLSLREVARVLPLETALGALALACGGVLLWRRARRHPAPRDVARADRR